MTPSQPFVYTVFLSLSATSTIDLIYVGFPMAIQQGMVTTPVGL